MNLFDNAEWLKIPKLKRLDDELLNYIDYIYNEFPELHYTDDEWVNIIKQEINYNNKEIINFANKYLNKYVRYVCECVNINNVIMYTFIKYDTNRLKNIVKKLSANQFFDVLASINFLDISFILQNIEKSKYLYAFFINHKRLYYSYIYARIIHPLYSIIISYLSSEYLIDNSMEVFLRDFYDRQVISNINNISSDSHLLKVINNEYIQKMQPYAYDLYNCYIKKFAAKPNFKLLDIILEYNIKLIDTNNSLKIINFIKIHNELLHQKTLNAIIASCNLTTEQIDELKASQLLNNI